MSAFSLSLDLFPLLAAVFAAVSCAVLGNFLVLRRLSLMGDAISHSVLPGLVIAFIITGSRNPLPMFVGAALAGIGTVVLVELIKRLGRVEPGAAMGVVFSVLFALGVLLIEQVTRGVDLDADCVLHGQLESLWWPGAPDTIAGLFTAEALHDIPRQVTTLAITCTAACAFVAIFFKELRIASFDPALATTQGFHAGVMHYALMVLVAGATVASFEAVGSILVIAMLICPAATARLLTDRLSVQVLCSVLIAIVTAVTGYFGASVAPAFFGASSVSAAGMIAVTAGALVATAALFSPRHGLIARVLRRRKLARAVALDDLLANLYRAAESDTGATPAVSTATLPARSRTVIPRAARDGLISVSDGAISLTPKGELAATEIVRRHRLWESYLVERAGLATDHVHEPAERLEHVPIAPPPGPRQDPHGRSIPQEPDSLQ